MATLKATSMEMESQLKDSQNTIMSLQEDLKAFEMENKHMADKWKKDINSWEVLKNKFQLVQRELNTLQQRPGSNASEFQQNWETDSAFQSGTSSPTFSVSSHFESPTGKQILAEDWQAKYQELQVSFEELGSKYNELHIQLSVSPPYFPIDDGGAPTKRTSLKVSYTIR